MAAKYFIRGCWKNCPSVGDSKKRIIETVDVIRELLKIETSPDSLLTMILAVIVPGTCAKRVQERITKEQGSRERSNEETVDILKALYFAKLDPPVTLIMVMSIIFPDFLGKPLLEKLRERDKAMTLQLKCMTPLKGTSQSQPAGIAGFMTP